MKNNVIVPFIDLKKQHNSIKDEIEKAIKAVFEGSSFSGGEFASNFEEEFAAFCNCRFAIGVGSGTDAIWLSLLALGVTKGDEVITVPNTFIATAEAISFCGAKPVFVDVDEKTLTMNPQLIEPAITDKTKAIIPVHLHGQPADMYNILSVAKKHGLFVIEDACQAHGAIYKNQPVGSMGHTGCFSFYPGKNIGACGEAGIVVTNMEKVDYDIRILHDHGQTDKNNHSIIGWNSRMDGLQGAILSVKLKYLPAWNETRRHRAELYNTYLSHVSGITIPQIADYAKSVCHIYAIQSQKRDALLNDLFENGIQCGIHYPVPIHLQKAYRHLNLGEGSYPVAEKCANKLLSLPIFPEINPSQIEHVAHRIKLSLHSY